MPREAPPTLAPPVPVAVVPLLRQGRRRVLLLVLRRAGGHAVVRLLLLLLLLRVGVVLGGVRGVPPPFRSQRGLSPSDGRRVLPVGRLSVGGRGLPVAGGRAPPQPCGSAMRGAPCGGNPAAGAAGPMFALWASAGSGCLRGFGAGRFGCFRK